MGEELPIRLGNSAERVHDRLRSDIIEQRLRPGARLSEGALAKRFVVSRTVVRAAVERLTGDSLVERANNRSARVATIGLERNASSLNRPEAVRLAGEFHVLLAELTGSVQLRRLVSDLVSRSSLILTTHDRPHSLSCAVREHEDIIRLLKMGEETSATSCMRTHLAGIAERAGLIDGPCRLPREYGW